MVAVSQARECAGNEAQLTVNGREAVVDAIGEG